ncbi:MAG: shikimate kinase [Rhodospirillaceae bacterium]|nr:shikimate kinase [Rhodospirillaceae bacterium]
MNAQAAAAARMPYDRLIVMIGMMGAGKSAIGRRLAQKLGMPFVDADTEIERAAGCSIEDIFSEHGESAFRDGERRVIARLLEGPPGVLATGGGAFMDPETRARLRERAITIWLKADLDTLVERVARRSNRPLLKQGDPRETLARLIALRYPVYAEADITVETGDTPASTTVERVIEALAAYRRTHAEAVQGKA